MDEKILSFNRYFETEFESFDFFRLTDSGLNADMPQPINNKAINLVLNVPPKNANGKNANSSAENKPIQKVKKTYI